MTLAAGFAALVVAPLTASDGQVQAIISGGPLGSRASIALSPTGELWVGTRATRLGESARMLALRGGKLVEIFRAADDVDGTTTFGPDGTAYFGAWDGKFYAIAPTGTKRWEYAAGRFISSSAAMGPDGTMYFGAGDGKLHAVAGTGLRRWTFATGDWVESSPAIAPDGTVVFGSWDGYVYALHPTGTLRWKFSLGSPVISSPAIGKSDTIYVASRQGRLAALRLTDGAKLWEIELGARIESSPVLGENSLLAVGCAGGRLHLVDVRTGLRIADLPLGASILAAPLARADGSFVVPAGNRLLAISAGGQVRWSVDTQSPIEGAPMLTSAGAIAVMSRDGKLRLIHSSSPAANTSWPMHRATADRSGIPNELGTGSDLPPSTNTPPSLSLIAEQVINANVATPALPFTIADAQSSPDSLVLLVASTNAELVPPTNITLGGTGANRTIRITPAPHLMGAARITITVSDGRLNTSRTFNLTVIEPINTTPQISAISSQSTVAGQKTAPLAFTVADEHTAALALTVSAVSSDPSVVPNSGLTIHGSGATRSIVVAPLPGAVGTSKITLSVSDGELTATTSFNLTVGAPALPDLTSSVPVNSTANLLHGFARASEISQWRFNNGPEFPGARGALQLATDGETGEQYAELSYDFRPPSPLPAKFDPRYVQASRSLSAAEAVDRTQLRLRVWKSKPEIRAVLRWTDATGQTLQTRIASRERVEQQVAGWQYATVDLASATSFWGGANNGRTQFPLRAVTIVCDASPSRDQGWLRFDDVEFLNPNGATLHSFDSDLELTTWTFTNGPEFPGARGDISRVEADGKSAARLAYDFVQPAQWSGRYDPRYVAMQRPLPNGNSATAIRLRFTASHGKIPLRIRYIDSTNQTFQVTVSAGFEQEGIPPGTWVERTIPFGPSSSRWGGANDGVVRPPITRITLLADPGAQRNAGHLLFDEISLFDESISVISLASAPVAAPAAPLAPLASRVGVNLGTARDARSIESARATGFGWVRVEAYWETIERVRGTYNFAALDQVIAEAEARGLQTLLVLAYGNPLYTGGGMKPPRTGSALTAYGDFSAAVASRYRTREVAFELWSKPDVPAFWNNAPSAAEFGALVRLTTERIRRVHPTATVITGGFAGPTDRAYGMLSTYAGSGDIAGASGLGLHFDWSEPLETQWGDLLRLRDAAAATTFGRLWTTEVGYSSTDLDPLGDGHSPTAQSRQAALAIRQLVLGWWADLPLNILYEFRDSGSTPSDPEKNYGLYAADGTEKPVLRAVRRFLNVAKDRRLIGLLAPENLPAGVHIAVFQGARDRVYLVWLEESAVGPVIVRLPSAAAAVNDRTGSTLSPITNDQGAWLVLQPGDGPIYVAQ